MTNSVTPPVGGTPVPPPYGGYVPPAGSVAPAGSVPPPGYGGAVPPPGSVPPAGYGGAVPPAGYVGAVPPGTGPAPAPKKPGRGAKVGKIAGVIAVALIIGALKFGLASVIREAFFGDKAKDAAVGDCIKADKNVAVDKDTEASAEVVDCGSAEAGFTVAGRIDGVTDTKSTACDKFFADKEEFYVYSSTSGGGYLLCLKPKP